MPQGLGCLHSLVWVLADQFLNKIDRFRRHLLVVYDPLRLTVYYFTHCLFAT